MSIFAMLLVGKVGGKVGRQVVQDMEVPKEHECEGPNSTELNLVMSDDTMFIHPPMLVVLRIVSKSSKDLQNSVCGERLDFLVAGQCQRSFSPQSRLSGPRAQWSKIGQTTEACSSSHLKRQLLPTGAAWHGYAGQQRCAVSPRTLSMPRASIKGVPPLCMCLMCIQVSFSEVAQAGQPQVATQTHQRWSQRP